MGGVGVGGGVQYNKEAGAAGILLMILGDSILAVNGVTHPHAPWLTEVSF